MSGRGQAFLLEVGCEEIPDRMLEAARVGLGEALAAALKDVRLPPSHVETFATPRRLAARLSGLPERQPDETVEVTGPPVAAAFGPDGAPTKAALGFAAGQGVQVGDLYRVRGAKGEVVAARRTSLGAPTPDVLAAVIPPAVLGLTFPKSMSWGRGVEFVRPIRWVVALLGREVVPMTLAGVQAGRDSRPRRGSGRGVALPIPAAADYETVLREARVLVDPVEREARIRAGLAEAVASAGGRLVEDEGLVAIVRDMVETPCVLSGSFPEPFLALPAEVLSTTLRHHQRAFSVADADGALLARFVGVANADADAEGAIARGYARVIAGRLGDARFFHEEDRRTSLEARRDMLARTRFHVALGSYGDKVARLERLVDALAALAGADAATRGRARRAAVLSKCDLATHMEHEFPELQGVVGGLYARAEGEAAEVWRALYDQYRPESVDDDLPRDPEGALLAAADRLDTLTGLIGVGVVPKGSTDPFALRRAALGLMRLLVERPLRVPVGEALAAAWKAWEGQEVKWRLEPQALRDELRRFLEARLRHLMERPAGRHRPDSITAVLAAGWDAPHEACARLEALTRLRGEEDFEALAAASKRIRNILTQADYRDREPPDAAALVEPPERDLHAAAGLAAERVAQARSAGDFGAALRAVAALRPQVDRFFDKVLVLAPDPALRRQRLALLASIAALTAGIADFAEIVVEGSS